MDTSLAAPIDNAPVKPPFVSDDVWAVARLASEKHGMSISYYIEKALLDEALILEQTNIGRKWFVKDERGNIGEVEFD